MGQKVNYNPNKKKKFKILKILIIVLVVIFVIYVFTQAIKRVATELENEGGSSEVVGYVSAEDFDTLKSLLEHYGCTYISESWSDDVLVVRLKFDRDLYTDDTSNETRFTNIVKAVTVFEDYINFELIDESRDIDILVTCEDGAIVEIKINGDINYYLNQDSIRNSQKETAEITEFEIESEELQALIDNNWNPTGLDLGTKDSTYNDYEIYFDEGFKYKVVGQEVFNLVFTEKYDGTIVSGLNASSTEEEIEEVLGEPTFIIESSLYGYIGEKNCVFFDFLNNQVSIYPIQTITEDEEEQFIELVEQMNESNDVKQFAMDLTSLWTDYDVYEFDSDYVELAYSLKGIKLEISSNSLQNGIFVYQNYSGDFSIINDLENIYVESTDLVYNSEYSRIIDESEKNYYIRVQGYDSSELYFAGFRTQGSINYLIFVSKDTNERPDVEVQEDVNSFVWKSESEVFYGVSNDGIYYFNILTQETQKLISGENENFEITSFENGILIYDDIEIIIEEE